jgi:outer membrane protein OmpA-like peptidoglycan-associated protein/Tol biopolymer transport system component
VLTCIAIIFTTAIWAQTPDLHSKNKKAIKIYEEAQRNYNLLYFDEAIKLLDESIATDENFLEAYLLKGQIHFEEKSYPTAIEYFGKALELDVNHDMPVIFLMLAESELEEAMIMEAVSHLESYKEQPDVSDYSKKNAEELIELAFFRKRMMENPVPYNPINLGANINTQWVEHSPTLTVDEQTLYFTRKESMGNVGGRDVWNEDLYVSHKDANGNWEKAKALGTQINTTSNEGASAISPDGNYLFFTSCDRRNGNGGCDLYIARKSGNQWVKARNLGAIINTRSWESQPSFAPDGRTLYFVKKVGARGRSRKDIYVSKVQNNGQWTKPVRISINTDGNEESPFAHPDGETFYFTSDGYPGLGGRDLFMVKIDSTGKFGEPQNLGYPINSSRDEVSLSVSANGKHAYFASGMEGGFGSWDLYRFDLPEIIRPVAVNYTKGKVYNSKTKEPVGAKFEIIDLATGNIVVESFSDKKTGQFLVTVPTGKEYAVNVSATGYLFYSANYNLEAGDDTSRVSFDVPLSPIEEGVAVVLNNVFYEFNSYELKDISKLELNKLVALLNKNTEIQIEIGGHTDNKGTKDYNQKLSENRAKSVYDYLIKNGIPMERLSYKGYNFSEPIDSNETESGRAKNRRTEFKITKVN